MRTERTWNLLGAPIDSIDEAGGTELGPGAPRDAGIVEALELRDAGDAETRLRDPARDPTSGVIADADVVALTSELRGRTAELLTGGDPLLVIGGCCSAVPGILGGIRDSGTSTGMVYVDGHLHLYDGESSETGEAADMPLSVALGRGPAEFLDAPALRKQEPTAVGEHFVSAFSGSDRDGFWLHVDLDVLDECGS